MSNLQHHILSAMRFYQNKKFDEARLQYEAALSVDPKFTTAMHGVALCLFQQEKWDASIAVAEKILVIDPDDADAQGHVSRCWMRKGDVPRAEMEAAKEKTIRWKLQLREANAAKGDKKPEEH
ncbi:MAG: tetratricopeptide repeat protein [Planctomycetota bacterium]